MESEKTILVISEAVDTLSSYKADGILTIENRLCYVPFLLTKYFLHF